MGKIHENRDTVALDHQGLAELITTGNLGLSRELRQDGGVVGRLQALRRKHWRLQSPRRHP